MDSNQHIRFRTLRPEHSASTNFATWAFFERSGYRVQFLFVRGANIGKDKIAA